MFCYILTLYLVSLYVVAGRDVSEGECSDAADQASLLSIQMTTAQRLAATAPIPKVQRRAWGDKSHWAAEARSGPEHLGDGRVMSRHPDEIEELFQDAQEEKEIVAEKAQFAALKDEALSAGKPYWAHPLRRDPLYPRVRGLSGCLLDGPIVNVANRQSLSSVRIINLDTRPDRWNYVRNSQGAKLLQEFKRWSAVRLRSRDDVDKLEGSRRAIALSKIANTDNTTGLTRARDSPNARDNMRYFAKLSCFMSHFEAINSLAQQARKSGQVYLVMEDDWEIRRNLPELLADITWAVGDDWDAIRLDCWFYTYHGRPRGVGSNQHVFRTGAEAPMDYGGTQAILYRSESIEKVAEYWRKEPFKEADAMFWTDKINSYCLNWNIVKRLDRFKSNVNHAAKVDFRLNVGDVEPLDTSRTGDVEPLDAYEAYLEKTRNFAHVVNSSVNPAVKWEAPETRAEERMIRLDHLVTCKRLRNQRRLRLRWRVK